MRNISARSFVYFVVIGGTATALQYLLIFILVKLAFCSPVAASTIGFVISAAFNYWANSTFTFLNSREHAYSIPRFLVTTSAGCLINALVLYLMTNDMGISFIYSQLTATGVVLIWNYTTSALWTFQSRQS